MLRHRIVDYVKPRVPRSYRRALSRARFRARLRTASLRILPDVLVVGAMRCGTSSLYKYLGRHPWVIPSLRKEVRFFSSYFAEGLPWYRAHFPTMASRALYSRTGRRLLTFESTPDYLLSPYAAERAGRLLPDTKIIVLLRDPVKRAYSHYKHMVAHGLEKLSFDEALDTEEARIGPDIEQLTTNPLTMGRALIYYSYKARSRYAVQLQRWFTHYPRNRFLILDADQFFVDPDPSLQKILRFLELPAWRPEDFRNHSYLTGDAEKARRGEKMSSGTRLKLERYFEPENEVLAHLVGDEVDLGFLK